MDDWLLLKEFSKPIDGEIIFVNQQEWEWLSDYIRDGEKSEDAD